MRGFDNYFSARLRAAAAFVNEGTFPGRLYRVDWFPGAVYAPDSPTVVQGEIYEMADPEILLAALDRYEEISDDEETSLYLRREVPVTTADGRALSCQIYLYNKPTVDLSRIESGRFHM